MGKLAGFRYRDVVRKLGQLGFDFAREGEGSHEVWANGRTGRMVFVVNHRGDMPEGTLRATLKQAGVDIDAFLAA